MGSAAKVPVRKRGEKKPEAPKVTEAQRIFSWRYGAFRVALMRQGLEQDGAEEAALKLAESPGDRASIEGAIAAGCDPGLLLRIFT